MECPTKPCPGRVSTLPNRSGGRPKKGPKAALKIATRSTPLLSGKVSEVPDAAFGWAMRLCGLAVVALLGLIVYQLVVGSQLSWHAFGWKFFGQSDWNPVEDQYGALPFVYGTLVSSLLALLIAVPLSIGVAVFITEMCPVRLRGVLSFTTELLAAIPSVVYGLWAIFVLVPVLREYVQPFLARTLGWTTLFSGPPYGIGMLAAGVILAIMIIPIISSISREVLTVVPQHQREAVLALGATPLGDDSPWGTAQCARWHRWRNYFGSGAGAWRNHGGDHGDRQPSRNR